MVLRGPSYTARSTGECCPARLSGDVRIQGTSARRNVIHSGRRGIMFQWAPLCIKGVARENSAPQHTDAEDVPSYLVEVSLGDSADWGGLRTDLWTREACPRWADYGRGAEGWGGPMALQGCRYGLLLYGGPEVQIHPLYGYIRSLHCKIRSLHCKIRSLDAPDSFTPLQNSFTRRPRFVHSTATNSFTRRPDSFTPLQNSFTPLQNSFTLLTVAFVHSTVTFLHSTPSFVHSTTPHSFTRRLQNRPRNHLDNNAATLTGGNWTKFSVVQLQGAAHTVTSYTD